MMVRGCIECDSSEFHLLAECNIVSARCYAVDKDELILSMYVPSRIHNNLIAGRFSLVGLRQLHTKLFADVLQSSCY